MRLDHIAYRTADRWKTANFFIDAFGYKVQTEFDLQFDDGSTTKCVALTPPEGNARTKISAECGCDNNKMLWHSHLHWAPEIFVSNGSPDSIVGKWVAERNGIGGIHHLAYEVLSVEETMREWQAKGWATFASTSPLECPGLVQVFTTPHELTGVIYEFIERKGDFGFCKENVQKLMESTKDL